MALPSHGVAVNKREMQFRRRSFLSPSGKQKPLSNPTDLPDAIEGRFGVWAAGPSSAESVRSGAVKGPRRARAAVKPLRREPPFAFHVRNTLLLNCQSFVGQRRL